MQEQGCSVAWRPAVWNGAGRGWGEPVLRSRRSQAGACQAPHRGTGPNTFNTASGCSVEKELRRARVVARSPAGERRLLSGQGRWRGRGARDEGWLESGEGSLVRVYWGAPAPWLVALTWQGLELSPVPALVAGGAVAAAARF